MARRLVNRSPSAPRFQRVVRAVGDIAGGQSFASIGAQDGAADVVFNAIGRVGRELINHDIKGQVAKVTEQAKAAGQAEAARAFADGDALRLREDETVAAEAFNASLQASYIEELDLGFRARTLELEREHGHDPEAFKGAFDADVAGMRARLPESWQPDFDRVTGRKRVEVLDRVTRRAIKQADDEANATHRQAADAYMDDMANALRRGDMEGAQEAQAQVLETINKRTDLSAQQKQTTLDVVEVEWNRHSVLGQFEDALAESPDAADAYIEAFKNSDTIKNPDDRTKLVGEMSAKLRDVVNAEKTAERERNATQKSENAVKISGLEIAVNNGTAGHVDIEAADRAGLFEFDVTARTRIAKAADTHAGDMALGAAFMAGDALADPKDKGHRKAADAYFKASEMPNMTSMNSSQAAATIGNFVARTGIIPSSVVSGLRASFSGGDVDTVVWSSDVIARIEETRPKALDAFAKGDIALAQTVNKLVRAGVAPEDAVSRAREVVDPASEAVRKIRMQKVNNEGYAERYTDWLEDHFNPIDLLDFFPFGPSSDAELEDPTRLLDYIPFMSSNVEDSGTSVQVAAEFETLFTDWFIRTGDKEISKANALRELSRTWGASSANGSLQVMKYPPEAYYGVESTGRAGEATNADEWIRTQLLTDVAASGMWDPDTDLADRVRLEADSITAREASTGKPTYSVFVLDNEGVYQPLLSETGAVLRWFPRLEKSGAAKVAAFKRALAAENDAGPMTQANMRARVQAAFEAAGGADAVR